MAAASTNLRQLADADRRVLESWLLEFDRSWDESRLAARASARVAKSAPWTSSFFTEA
jgi:hypothetical protein